MTKCDSGCRSYLITGYSDSNPIYGRCDCGAGEKTAILAERERCAEILIERHRQITTAERTAENVHDLAVRSNEVSYLWSVLKCTCGKSLQVSGANHATDCPTYLWWFSNEANVNAGG